MAAVSRRGAWLVALRIPTLSASVVPVLVGTAAAGSKGSFSPGVFVAALLAALLIQTGTNLSNDYFDYVSGADTAERKGPVRLIQSGVMDARRVLMAALASFGLAVLLGLYLVSVGGWPILLIGVASILAGLAYTGGPYPLGYNGLGDLFVFVFFGLIGTMGTYYLHAGDISPLAWGVAIPVGLLVTNILVVNNVRDVETDRAAGKRTLAVRLGRPAARAQFVLSLVVAYVIPPALWLAGLASPWCWLTWLSLPLALTTAQGVVGTNDGPRLNAMLKRTGQLHLLFGCLLSLGLLL